jgi:hypothetical protein
MLRTSLLSGLILDGLLFVYMVVSVLVAMFRQASQTKAIGLMAVAGWSAEMLLSGVVFGSAGALATYLALKWTRMRMG